MWTYKCDRCGAALDPGERCDCQECYQSPDILPTPTKSSNA